MVKRGLCPSMEVDRRKLILVTRAMCSSLRLYWTTPSLTQHCKDRKSERLNIYYLNDGSPRALMCFFRVEGSQLKVSNLVGVVGAPLCG